MCGSHFCPTVSNNFRDELQSCFSKSNICKKENQKECGVNLPDVVILEERWCVYPNINRIPMKLKGSSIPHNVDKIPKFLKRSCVDYLDIFYNFGIDFCDQITIIFISDIGDNSYLHYKEQPRATLCRNLEKFFIEGERGTEDLEDFE